VPTILKLKSFSGGLARNYFFVFLLWGGSAVSYFGGRPAKGVALESQKNNAKPYFVKEIFKGFSAGAFQGFGGPPSVSLISFFSWAVPCNHFHY